MAFDIRITEASGDIVSEERIEATARNEAEQIQASLWNECYGHTADRYKSELLEDGAVISTIGGWDEDED